MIFLGSLSIALLFKCSMPWARKADMRWIFWNRCLHFGFLLCYQICTQSRLFSSLLDFTNAYISVDTGHQVAKFVKICLLGPTVDLLNDSLRDLEICIFN